MSTDHHEDILSFILAQEKSASRVYAAYVESKGFDPAKHFAKNQAQSVFQAMHELRNLLQSWDEQSGDPTFQEYYPEKQPPFDQAYLQLVGS